MTAKTITVLRIFDRTGSYTDTTSIDVVDFEQALGAYANRDHGSTSPHCRANVTFLRVTRKKDGARVSISCASIVRAEEYEEYVD